MHKFEKMMEKKMKDKKGDMPEHERDAKMSVLEHVRQMAHDMMKDKLDGGMKKVSVASPSKEGLKEGLETAHDMLGDGAMHGDEHGDLEAEESGEESPMHEAAESADEEMAEHEEGGSIRTRGQLEVQLMVGMVVLVALHKQEDHPQQHGEPHEGNGLGALILTQRMVGHRQGHA